MKALKLLKDTVLKGVTQSDSGSTEDSSKADDLYDFFDDLKKSIDEDDHDDFAEVGNVGEELTQMLTECSLCLIPDSLRHKLIGMDSQDDEISLEEVKEKNEFYSAEALLTPSHLSTGKKNRKKGTKERAKEDIDDDFIEAISGILPQCQDVAADFVRNKLHRLVKKKRWVELHHKLRFLANNKALIAETSEKKQLEMMIRQVDENGRTPLSLACGKSQAPREVVRLLLDGFPYAASMEDKNGNLPLHHFCHSYGRLTDVPSPERRSHDSSSDQIMILRAIHSAYPAGTKHANIYGNTPLHVYIEHQCSNNMTQTSLRVALALLKLDPEVAFTTNQSGSLPMHYVGKKNSSEPSPPNNFEQVREKALMSSFLKDLHKANPNAVMTPNNFGATPFFVAVIYNASFDVWQELLALYPEAAKLQNGRGMSPISTFWNMFVSLKAKKKYFNLSEQQALEEGKIIEKNRLLMSRIMCSTDLRFNSPSRLIDFWLKIELMIRAACFGSILEKMQGGETWSPIHSICTIEECPCDLLKFALQMYGEEATKTNNEGNLPLHVLLHNAQKNATARQAKNAKTMVEHLVRISPTSVSCRTLKGELPLHIALRSCMTWNTGIQTLVEANTFTVEVRDPITRLFPFMQAAVGDLILRCIDDEEAGKSGFILEQLNTIYGLLIISPGMANPKPKPKKSLSERGSEVMRLQQRRVHEKQMKTRKEIDELHNKMLNLQRQNELLIKRGGSVIHGHQESASVSRFKKIFRRSKDPSKFPIKE